MSPAAISAIEREKSSPTLATMQKVLKALGTDFAEFFTQAGNFDSEPAFTADQMQELSDSNRTYTIVFPKREDIQFEMFHETILSSEEESEWEVHNCDVGGILLSGSCDLQIQGGGEWCLRRGDAFYVRAALRHRLVVEGRTKLKLITVYYPPRY
jgi:mannose-6-phosphate isomerase-like protein (cupin superfamily)